MSILKKRATAGGAVPPPPRRRLSPKAVFWQAALLVVLATIATWLVMNARAALDARGMTSGLGFLFDKAQFSLGEAFFHFRPGETYLTAFAVGLGNTVMVSVVSIITASLLGTLVGLARLSRNGLASGLAQAYVYAFRNTPQLVQIVFWYSFFTLLPHARNSWSIGELIFASNRGVSLPAPENGAVFAEAAAAGFLGFLVAWGVSILAERRRRRTGLRWKPLRAVQIALILAPALVVWAAAGAPAEWSVPVLKGFNFKGGATLSPEFLAIYFGLSFYIAAYIAEIVRAGIGSVDFGQFEAANTIGLSKSDIYRRIVAPQALRVIIPPLAAQYVSLLKNSSLGVAIGYPDLFSISNTMLTYSGRTIEVLCIMAAVYLVMALAIGAASNAANRYFAIPGRTS
ncbi:ABC transporter permease subunit [Breoghania sp. JC706]|uniref:amino acid ABC transporter permease n=1 Tax=Breoghania sp. JC706 TaxID=3117732 RepID=UPI003008CEBA